jgi:hypothetical protein
VRKRKSRLIAVVIMSLSFSVALHAQTSKTKMAHPASASAEDVDALREIVSSQQQELKALRADVQRLMEMNARGQQSAQQAQSAADQAKTSATDAQTAVAEAKKAADHAEFSAAEAKTKEQLDQEASGKKVDEVASVVRRFRPLGDIRVRFEPIFEGDTPDRYRARVRLRIGVEGKLNEDFIGGFQLATGTTENDPVSTNFTDSQFFSRKPIGVDKAYINYQPAKQKWLTLTAGKFAPNWMKTSAWLDPDLNPEGGAEKLSFDVKHLGIVRNVSLVGMQLVYNEVAGSNLPVALGGDSVAFGGQGSVTLQLGKRITTTFAGTGLNWINADPVIKAITAKTLAGNRNTNVTIGAGSNIRYASKFTYADFIADAGVKTWWDKYPLHLTLDLLKNPRAASDRNQALWAEAAFGNSKEKYDLQFGYAFGHIEQDAVIAAFNESELRAPTNVIQNKIYLQWLAQKNTTLSFTEWIGRTLDRNLQNAALPAGLPANQLDPYLNRMQFDVIYKF